MKAKKIQEIKFEWEMFESAEPDISTERLIEMVAQQTKTDAADVCEAIPKP